MRSLALLPRILAWICNKLRLTSSDETFCNTQHPLLRALSLNVVAHCSAEIDKCIANTFLQIMKIHDLTAPQWKLARGPICHGGMGLISLRDEAPLHALSHCLNIRALGLTAGGFRTRLTDYEAYALANVSRKLCIPEVLHSTTDEVIVKGQNTSQTCHCGPRGDAGTQASFNYGHSGRSGQEVRRQGSLKEIETRDIAKLKKRFEDIVGSDAGSKLDVFRIRDGSHHFMLVRFPQAKLEEMMQASGRDGFFIRKAKDKVADFKVIWLAGNAGSSLKVALATTETLEHQFRLVAGGASQGELGRGKNHPMPRPSSSISHTSLASTY